LRYNIKTYYAPYIEFKNVLNSRDDLPDDLRDYFVFLVKVHVCCLGVCCYSYYCYYYHCYHLCGEI